MFLYTGFTPDGSYRTASLPHIVVRKDGSWSCHRTRETAQRAALKVKGNAFSFTPFTRDRWQWIGGVSW